MPELAPVPGAQPAQTAPADVDQNDAALILAFTRAQEIPAPLEKWYRAFDRDRRYVNNDCMVLDAEDAVGTNHILRNQYTLMALLNSRDADISIKPDDTVWEPVPEIDPMMGVPTGIMLPGTPPPELALLARTQEILARKLLREARFRQQLNGAIQDIETNAIMFVKVNQQEDLKRDPIGNYRFNDQQDNYALYNFWQQKVAAGEIVEGTAEMQRFKDIEVTVRQYTAAGIRADIQANPMPPQVDPMTGMPPAQIDPMTGQPAVDPATGMPMPMPPPVDPRELQAQAIEAGTLPIDPNSVPEVAHWIGFPIDFVQPEDIRFDWDITRPEDFWRSKQIQHRVYADRDETAAKYGMTPEEAKLLPTASTSESTTQTGNGDATKRDGELTDKQIGKQVELWECWDRQTNCVYVYAKGMQKMLQKYVPRVVWRNWYPFIPMLFNRTTGRLVGVSSTTLQRPAQEEINLMRTLDRHAKKACFPRILIRRGVFQKGEKQKYKRAMPYEVIELETPDALNDAIKETATTTYNPQLTDSSRAEMDLQRMAGVSLVSGGAVGVSNSATETATAQQGTDALTDYRRGIIEDIYVDVVTCLLDMASTVLPEQNVKALAGPGAFWPTVDRETLWRSMYVKIRAGSTGKPDTEKRLKWMTNIIQVAGALGLAPKGPQILDELTRDAGIYDDLSQFFQIAPPPMAGGPGGAIGPGPKPNGGGGGINPTPPGLDSQQGQGGGNPNEPMSAAPSPSSIPNRPQV